MLSVSWGAWAFCGAFFGAGLRLSSLIGNRAAFSSFLNASLWTSHLVAAGASSDIFLGPTGPSGAVAPRGDVPGALPKSSGPPAGIVAMPAILGHLPVGRSVRGTASSQITASVWVEAVAAVSARRIESSHVALQPGDVVVQLVYDGNGSPCLVGCRH